MLRTLVYNESLDTHAIPNSIMTVIVLIIFVIIIIILIIIVIIIDILFFINPVKGVNR